MTSDRLPTCGMVCCRTWPSMAQHPRGADGALWLIPASHVPFVLTSPTRLQIAHFVGLACATLLVFLLYGHIGVE